MINAFKHSETRTLQGEEVEVALRPANRPEESGGKFPPLEAGTSRWNGMRVDRDVPVRLRDGAVIYTDVYRPDNDEKVPAIIAWSPYGKRIGYVGGNLVPGVPIGTYSEGTKTEGPDPEYWVPRGYAIINPDARGAGNSEGTLQWWNHQEGRDAADLIEWVGMSQWCTGRVGMSGSSWLGISQWFAAAERPEHLACIAPWEGMTDVYRHLAVRGGIREVGFTGFLGHTFTGPGLAEDPLVMSEARPTFDAYWQDKVADLGNIEVPTYVTAGWSHFHLAGSMEAFRKIGTDQKWLRAHRDFEWPDFYAPENLRDLELFFERYLKNRRNGWEMTPRVRIDVMDRGDRDAATGRAEKDFPLPDTEYRALYLDAANRSLRSERPAASSEVTYEAAEGSAAFDIRFTEDTEITGYLKLRLWVEARGNNDLDLFAVVQKADDTGAYVPTLVMEQPHPGSPGMLRVSHRQLDEAASTPWEPVHTHAGGEYLEPGQIVPVDISVWPTSRLWHAGETLRVVISGHYVREAGWFEPFAWDLRNTGEHVIHTGGEYDSHLLVPVIPTHRKVIPGPLIGLPPALSELGSEHA